MMIRFRDHKDDSLAQHDHLQALAGTLRLPNYAAFASAFLVALADALQKRLDRGHLLVPGDLLLWPCQKACNGGAGA